MVPLVAAAVDVALIRALAQEILDLSVGQKLHAGFVSKTRESTAYDRVG